MDELRQGMGLDHDPGKLAGLASEKYGKGRAVTVHQGDVRTNQHNLAAIPAVRHEGGGRGGILLEKLRLVGVRIDLPTHHAR